MTLLKLSSLAIQEFDAIGKNEHELDNPAYMSNSNNRKSKPKFCLRNSFNFMLPAHRNLLHNIQLGYINKF